AQAGSKTDLHAVEDRSAFVTEVSNTAASGLTHVNGASLDRGTCGQADLNQQYTITAGRVTTNVEVDGHVSCASVSARCVSSVNPVTHDEQTTRTINGSRNQTGSSASQAVGVIDKDVHGLVQAQANADTVLTRHPGERRIVHRLHGKAGSRKSGDSGDES